MRIRLIPILLMLILFCTCAAFPASAEDVQVQKENAPDIKNIEVTDFLPQKDSVRWYQFTLENDADVVVRLTTEFTEPGDYWFVTVYREGSSISERASGVGGSSVREGDLLLENRKPGTYYVRVQSYTEGSAGAPEKYYMDMPYTIQVITEGYVHPTGETKRTTVSKAGEIVAVIGGKVYIKRNDGEAYVACFVTGDSSGVKSGPILLAETTDAVEYYTPAVTDSMWSFEKLELEGKTYYYTAIRDGYQGAAADATLYRCGEGKQITPEAAANELLKLHFGISPLEEEEKVKEKAEQTGNFWAYIVIAVIVVFGIAELIMLRHHSKKRHCGSGGYSDSTDRVPTEEDMRQLADMDTAKNIAKNAHTPGYEADGPAAGPGPEDFAASDSIW